MMTYSDETYQGLSHNMCMYFGVFLNPLRFLNWLFLQNTKAGNTYDDGQHMGLLPDT